ncbi:uncharacterized protein LOC34618551 [Cyclospora cayetanensis]|uniref:Uncharacterized protein LOC34618551 n=1 Tax=Cyclospora cayetanensis TaxID=88456 RepID=A0A6P6RQJ5_9EIME|nr:uncharacterized protein LOC34618551 [Cyclospora cayetanensis]
MRVSLSLSLSLECLSVFAYACNAAGCEAPNNGLIPWKQAHRERQIPSGSVAAAVSAGATGKLAGQDTGEELLGSELALLLQLSSSPISLGGNRGMQSVSLGAALPFQLPMGVSAFARVNAELPLEPLQELYQQQLQPEDKRDAERAPLQWQTFACSKENLLQLQRQVQQQLLRLQQSGLRGEVLLGVQTPHALGCGGVLRCLASLDKEKPRLTFSASQGGNEVALTLSKLRLLGFALQSSLDINKSKVAVETAYNFEQGETSMRVAAAGLTGAATRGLLPTLLGVEVRARGPLGSPLRGKAAQEGLATAAEGASSFAEKPLAEAAHAEAGKAEKDKGLKGQRSEGNNRMAGLSEAPDVSMGLTFAFGEKGDLLVEPKFHLGER